MRKYRSDVKTGVLMARGLTIDARLVELPTALDEAILRLARRVLPSAQRMVFFVLYHCTKDIQTAHDAMQRLAEKHYKLETIEEYARNARQAVEAHAEKAQEIDQWMTTFLKSRKTS